LECNRDYTNPADFDRDLLHDQGNEKFLQAGLGQNDPEIHIVQYSLFCFNYDLVCSVFSFIILPDLKFNYVKLT